MTTTFLNQWKGENDCRNYLTINLHESYIFVAKLGFEPCICRHTLLSVLWNQAKWFCLHLIKDSFFFFLLLVSVLVDILAYLHIFTHNTMLWADSADDKLMIFFIFFLETRIWYFMQIVFLGDIVFQILFSRKNKKNISRCRLQKFLPSMQSIKSTK